jgi:heme-degrading monooxygenase HmoA
MARRDRVIHILWEFRIQEGRAAAFEELYGPEGGWVRLFRKARGYERTLLVRDGDDPRRYLTIDVWRDAACYEAFRREQEAEHAGLDRDGLALTEVERRLGQFEEIA